MVVSQIINILNTAHNYIRRNNLNFSSSVVSINNGDATYTYVKAPSTRKSAAVTLVNDYLFCVNSSAELFQVNPLNGQLTYLSDMPMGSVTCAVDQANKCVYSIGNKSPYPLMKYSIPTNTWTTVKSRNGPKT
jgi:hypothetical protein